MHILLWLLPSLPVAFGAALVPRNVTYACNNSPDLCSRSYSNVTYLGAHDSPFLRNSSNGFTDSGNQNINSSAQLDAGVRLLTAQVHNSNGEWHLCHTSCSLLDVGKLSGWLSEIKTWMDNNPREVVTILLVNSDNASPSALDSEYKAANITSYAYTPPTTTTTIMTWPALQDMISNNTRLVTFVASLPPSSNTVAPYLLDEFTFVFENNYDVTSLSNFTCTPDRPPAVQGNTQMAITSGRLPLMNHFLDNKQAFFQTPDYGNITTTNAQSGAAGNLGGAAANCSTIYGKAPTYVLVDFFDQASAISTVDALNGITPVGRAGVPNVAAQASTSRGFGRTDAEDRRVGAPAPTELQISVRSTGLCGSDLHNYHHYRNGDILVREPMSLGHESAGVLLAVGSAVEDFVVGDRVALEVGLPCTACKRCLEGRYNICQELKFRSSAKAFPHFQGTLQETINHPAAWCHKLSENVSFDLGAILEPLGVAIHASRRARIARDSSTLVFGAGAVGLLCAAMSKVEGSSNVTIADIQAERVDFAINNGFAHRGFVVPRKQGQDIEERLRLAKVTAAIAAEIKTVGGCSLGEYDTVFECTGVESCTQAAIYATRAGGKVVIVGMGNPVQTLPISAAALREVDIIGTFRYANTYPRAIELVASKDSGLPDLHKLVTHRYHGLESVPQAFETASKASDEHGSLVLKVIVEVCKNEADG